MSIIRITVDESEDCTCPSRHPHLDEIVATNVAIHFEAMNQSQWWMSITDLDTGRVWDVNFGAVNTRAHGYAFIEEQ